MNVKKAAAIFLALMAALTFLSRAMDSFTVIRVNTGFGKQDVVLYTIQGEGELMPGDVLEYLNYVVHLRIEKPRWCGSRKTRLKNLEVKLAVEKQVEEQKYVFLKQDISPLKSIYFSLF